MCERLTHDISSSLTHLQNLCKTKIRVKFPSNWHKTSNMAISISLNQTTPTTTTQKTSHQSDTLKFYFFLHLFSISYPIFLLLFFCISFSVDSASVAKIYLLKRKDLRNKNGIKKYKKIFFYNLSRKNRKNQKIIVENYKKKYFD